MSGSAIKVLFLIKILCYIIFAQSVKLNLNVGVLLMTNSTFPVDLRRVGPAIDMGVEEVRRRYDIQFNTVVANYSVWCQRARYIAPGYLGDMYYKQNISVFVGPACSYAVETSARIAEYLRVPLVTGLGDLVIRKPMQEDMFETTAILSYNIRKLSGRNRSIKERKWIIPDIFVAKYVLGDRENRPIVTLLLAITTSQQARNFKTTSYQRRCDVTVF